MRSKEDAHDYRYFPDPDLAPVEVPAEWVEQIDAALPELPHQRRLRYRERFGLNDQDSAALTASKAMADFFEATVAAGADAKQAANWLMGDIAAYVNANKMTVQDLPLTPANLAELITLIEDGTISGTPEGAANYYDLLVNGAFGNFRQLLEDVTLSPMMGLYLSSLRNSKADPVTGQTPDENYAREVMQLFTIGLVMLQPDGTLQLGSDGLPVATYNQTTITEMAKVFTGWAYPSSSLTAFRTASTNYFSPMQLFPSYHDDTAKNLSPVSATPIPAAQGGTKDLQLALDALFTHQNTAPFISKLAERMAPAS